METKKSKVIKRKIKTTDSGEKVVDKYDNQYILLAFENGDWGEQACKPDGKYFEYFKEGEEAEYILGDEKIVLGKKGNKIIVPKKDFTPRAGGAFKYEPKKKDAYKAECVSYAGRYTTDLVVAAVIKPEEIGDFLKVYTGAMWSLLDNLKDLD